MLDVIRYNAGATDTDIRRATLMDERIRTKQLARKSAYRRRCRRKKDEMKKPISITVDVNIGDEVDEVWIELFDNVIHFYRSDKILFSIDVVNLKQALKFLKIIK